ncbi:MAG: LytR C-terminal domain-containing protein [Acidimicrobiales bacterium]|nr:LytR C-terminal domain-containing protein [Acidimicrobiales bacterium]
MNTGAHDAGGGFGQSVGTSAGRGVAVILAAVAVGAILMWLGYSDQTVDASSDDSAQTTTDDGAATDDGASSDDSASTDDGVTSTAPPSTETTTTTAPPAVARPADQVKVLVLNAAVNKRGIAGRGTAIVEQAGYVTLKAGDAKKDQPTEIQYAPDYEADAIAVAETFGLDSSVVVPFPAELNTDDPGDANVIVIIGLDGKIDI